MKFSLLSTSILFALPFTTNAQQMLCNELGDCYESSHDVVQVNELGSAHAAPYRFENAFAHVDLTLSEVLGLGQKLYVHEGGVAASYFAEFEPNKYGPSEFFHVFVVNKDLTITISKPTQTVLLRRGENGQILELNFDTFDSVLRKAFIYAQGQKLAQRYFAQVVSETTYQRLEKVLSVCTTQGSGSETAAQNALNRYLELCVDRVEDAIDPTFTGLFDLALMAPSLDDGATEFSASIHFEQDKYNINYYRYEGITSYADLVGEAERDYSYSEKVVLEEQQDSSGNKVSDEGYVFSSLSVNGKEVESEADAEERQVAAQVSIEQAEVFTRVNDLDAYSGEVNYEVDGLSSFSFTNEDDDFSDYAFDGIHSGLFGHSFEQESSPKIELDRETAGFDDDAGSTPASAKSEPASETFGAGLFSDLPSFATESTSKTATETENLEVELEFEACSGENSKTETSSGGNVTATVSGSGGNC